MNDSQIVALFFDRDQRAIEETAAKYGNYCYSIVHNILQSKEDAEEAVSDTYLAIWNIIPPEKPDPLEGYVYRTGRNVALKKLRFLRAQKRSSQYDISLDELSAVLSGGNLEEALDARELGLAIDRFLDTLPKQSRILFMRRYWFMSPIKDIARDVDMSESAIKVSLMRTRNEFKAHLEKEGIVL